MSMQQLILPHNMQYDINKLHSCTFVHRTTIIFQLLQMIPGRHFLQNDHVLATLLHCFVIGYSVKQHSTVDIDISIKQKTQNVARA